MISSEVGFQQGDPAGPLGFSLSVHPIIQDLRSEFNVWYLDDGTIAGDPKVVLDDFSTIITRSRELGLKVNASKCELFFCGPVNSNIISEFHKIAPDISVVQHLSLLGSPISENCMTNMFENKIEEISLLLTRIPDLKFHIGYYLIKHCLFVPKLNYLIRTTPSWKILDIIKQMDSDIKSCFEYLINTKLSDDKWTLCSLPLKHGGMSIRKLSDLILPAFLSSAVSSLPLIRTMLNENMNVVDIANYSEGLRLWSDRFGGNSIPECSAVQHQWDDVSCKKICDEMVFSTQVQKILYEASTCKESNGWLQVLPSRTVGTLLDNNTFRISAALRIGGVICAPHRCVCGEKVSENGRHGLSCAKSAGRQSRHSSLNDTIRRALTSAKIPAILEPTGMSREDGRRPDGMFLIPWKSGKCLVWDSTCADTLAPSYEDVSKKGAGNIAETAATKKIAKYRSIMEDYHFIPFAVESLGPWCEAAKKFTKDLGDRLTSVTGDRRSRAFLDQRISIAIQKGNAACVMGTLPSCSKMEEIFYL